MTIQRYDLYYIDESGVERDALRTADPNGGFVMYSDHLAAQAELIEALEQAAVLLEDEGCLAGGQYIRDLLTRHKGPQK